MKLSVRRRSIGVIAVAACHLLALSACGGGGGGGGGGSTSSVASGSVGVQAMWQQPGGGVSSQLPGAVQTVRLVFESQDGFDCCVAVNPDNVPPDATGNRSLLLDSPSSGAATLMLAGFATDFAPAPAGITQTCTTSPAGIGQPCASRP